MSWLQQKTEKARELRLLIARCQVLGSLSDGSGTLLPKAPCAVQSFSVAQARIEGIALCFIGTSFNSQSPFLCFPPSLLPSRPVSTGSLAQQYAHPSATLHPHPPHPQPAATPTGQQQSQHGGSHPAPSPVQVRSYYWQPFGPHVWASCPESAAGSIGLPVI